MRPPRVAEACICAALLHKQEEKVPPSPHYIKWTRWSPCEPWHIETHGLAASIPPANPVGHIPMALPCQAMSPPSRGPLYCWHGPSAVRANLPWLSLKNVLSRPALALARCPPARCVSASAGSLTLHTTQDIGFLAVLAFLFLFPPPSPMHPPNHIAFSLQPDLTKPDPQSRPLPLLRSCRRLLPITQFSGCRMANVSTAFESTPGIIRTTLA